MAVEHHDDPEHQIRITTFEYDERGRRTVRTLPMGQDESWTNDDLGRMETHTNFNDQVTEYAYDHQTPSWAGSAAA